MRTIHYLSDIIEETLKRNPNHDPAVGPHNADKNRVLTEQYINPSVGMPKLRKLSFWSSDLLLDLSVSADVEVKPGDGLRISATLTETKTKYHSSHEFIVWQLSDGCEYLQVVQPAWVAIRNGSKLKTNDSKDYVLVPNNCVGFYIVSIKSGYNFTYEAKRDKTPSHINQFNLMNIVKFNVTGK